MGGFGGVWFLVWQEFASMLLDKMHEDLNRVKHKPTPKELDLDNMDPYDAANLAWKQSLSRDSSVIVDLFQGQFRSVTQCCTCKYESCTYSPFTFLSLPIPMHGHCTLEDCIQRFSQAEHMTGGNRWCDAAALLLCFGGALTASSDTDTDTQTHVHAHTHRHTHRHRHKHTHTHTNKHTHTNTDKADTY